MVSDKMLSITNHFFFSFRIKRQIKKKRLSEGYRKHNNS